MSTTIFFLGTSVRHIEDSKNYYMYDADRSDLQFVLASDGWSCHITDLGYSEWTKSTACIYVGDGGTVVSSIPLAAFFELDGHAGCVAYVDQTEWGKAMNAELALMDSLQD